jgi:hypothetical protein
MKWRARGIAGRKQTVRQEIGGNDHKPEWKVPRHNEGPRRHNCRYWLFNCCLIKLNNFESIILKKGRMDKYTGKKSSITKNKRIYFGLH